MVAYSMHFRYDEELYDQIFRCLYALLNLGSNEHQALFHRDGSSMIWWGGGGGGGANFLGAPI